MAITTQEAEIYCRMELKSRGLKDYSIVWMKTTNTLGLCDPWKKQILLSEECLRSAEMLKEILLHEEAHALDYQERGTFQENGRNDFHGKNWKKWCLTLGIRPRRLVTV